MEQRSENYPSVCGEQITWEEPGQSTHLHAAKTSVRPPPLQERTNEVREWVPRKEAGVLWENGRVRDRVGSGSCPAREHAWSHHRHFFISWLWSLPCQGPSQTESSSKHGQVACQGAYGTAMAKVQEGVREGAVTNIERFQQKSQKVQPGLWGRLWMAHGPQQGRRKKHWKGDLWNAFEDMGSLWRFHYGVTEWTF